MKTTTIYSFYVVEDNGIVQERDFVKGINEFGEESYYEYPRSKHDIWKTLILGSDMFETRQQAADEAARVINNNIIALEKELLSIQKEITTLRNRSSSNYDED